MHNEIHGLTLATQEVFEQVSRLECINGLFLCGGTGQSLQMNHRLSEDLDFELIGLRKDRPALDFGAILGEIKATFPDAREEILGEDHFLVFLRNLIFYLMTRYLIALTINAVKADILKLDVEVT